MPNFDQEINVDLPDLVKTTLFQIAQEAIRNALKYAQARHILMEVYREEGKVCMKIADDGRGFTTPRRLTELARANHFGLLGISERVNSLHGEFEIQSHPFNGTEITIKLPAGVMINTVKEPSHD